MIEEINKEKCIALDGRGNSLIWDLHQWKHIQTRADDSNTYSLQVCERCGDTRQILFPVQK